MVSSSFYLYPLFSSYTLHVCPSSPHSFSVFHPTITLQFLPFEIRSILSPSYFLPDLSDAPFSSSFSPFRPLSTRHFPPPIVLLLLFLLLFLLCISLFFLLLLSSYSLCSSHSFSPSYSSSSSSFLY